MYPFGKDNKEKNRRGNRFSPFVLLCRKIVDVLPNYGGCIKVVELVIEIEPLDSILGSFVDRDEADVLGTKFRYTKHVKELIFISTIRLKRYISD